MRRSNSAALVQLIGVLCLAIAIAAAPYTKKVRVHGTIRTANGTPAVGVVIKFFRVLPVPTGGANKFSYPVVVAITNDQGEWKVDLEPGSYRYMAGNPKTTGSAGGTIVVEDGKDNQLDIALPRRTDAIHGSPIPAIA